MSFEIVDALRTRRPLKVSLQGPTGSGKSYTGIRLAMAMIRAGIGTRFVVGDSENESANLYAGETQDGETWQYKTFQIKPAQRNPLGYIAAYEYAVGQGYDIVMLDSMTHAWLGALNKVDEIGAANRGDKFGAGWRVVTPQMERMIATLTDERAHLIATCRVKSEYEVVTTESGKKKPEKVGLKSVDRDGMDYEYDVVVRITADEQMATVDKIRGCTAMNKKVGHQPGPDFWGPLFDWWKSGAETKPLFDRLRDGLTAADDLDGLKAMWVQVMEQASRLTAGQLAELTALKDEMKLKLAGAGGEGPGSLGASAGPAVA